MTPKTPLFGEKTHPLSEHAKDVMRILRAKPLPCQQANSGVVDRLLRGELVKIVPLPSPYDSHKGKNCDHLVLTIGGIAYLEQIEGEN